MGTLDNGALPRVELPFGSQMRGRGAQLLQEDGRKGAWKGHIN